MKFELLRNIFRSGGKSAAPQNAKNSARAKSRSRRGGRRGSEMPSWVRKVLKFSAVLLTVILILAVLQQAFYSFYFRSNSLFVLKDTKKNVNIDTGKTVTSDLIKEFLGIQEGVNLFSIDVDAKRTELLRIAPSIKDIVIVRRMPDILDVSIIERDPVVCIGQDGRVADEAGVVFVRYKNTDGLPIIIHSSGNRKARPGDRLSAMDLAAVKLVASTFRPECKLRMHTLDSSFTRYIKLTFHDGRTAKIAWQDMTEFNKNSYRKMIRQYDNLVQCMISDVGKIHYAWDAQLERRIFGKRRNFTE